MKKAVWLVLLIFCWSLLVVAVLAASDKPFNQQVTLINTKLGLLRLAGRNPQVVTITFRDDQIDLQNELFEFYLQPEHWEDGYTIKVFKSDVPRRLKMIQRRRDRYEK